MMKFSVLLTVTGLPDRSYQEIDYGDVKRAVEKSGLDVSEGEPGDHDYVYLAKEDGMEDEELEEIRAHLRILGDGVTYDLKKFSWSERLGIEGRELTASGIIGKKAFRQLIDDLGAQADDCQTMGTLGGPLSGGMPYCVPDISFSIGSCSLLDSIRVTPVPCDRNGEPLEGDERTWDRLRSATLAVFAD